MPGRYRYRATTTQRSSATRACRPKQRRPLQLPGAGLDGLPRAAPGPATPRYDVGLPAALLGDRTYKKLLSCATSFRFLDPGKLSFSWGIFGHQRLATNSNHVRTVYRDGRTRSR